MTQVVHSAAEAITTDLAKIAEGIESGSGSQRIERDAGSHEMGAEALSTRRD